MTSPIDRVRTSMGDLSSRAIAVDIAELGALIGTLIQDVGRLHYVSIADLNVFGARVDSPPGSIEEAMRYGTLIFDAIYYFALPVNQRPTIVPGPDGAATLQNTILVAKKRLLWTSLFLMLRGSYPSSQTSVIGTDVPAFLVNIAGMNESPAQVAAGIASFDLGNIDTNWIRAIDWTGLAPEIRQRLALGLAGYRMLGPFKLYDVAPGSPQDVIRAHAWVRNIATLPADYAIMSATRSAALISQLGSWNKALGNLILLSFTPAQIDEMIANKILFARPVRDPRADTWRGWATGAQIALTDPVRI